MAEDLFKKGIIMGKEQREAQKQQSQMTKPIEQKEWHLKILISEWNNTIKESIGIEQLVNDGWEHYMCVSTPINQQKHYFRKFY